MQKATFKIYKTLVRSVYAAFAATVLLWALSSVVPFHWPMQDAMQRIACTLGGAILANAAWLALCRRMLLDRIIADSSFGTLLSVVLTIVSVPVCLFGYVRYIAGDEGVKSVELIHAPEIYYDKESGAEPMGRLSSDSLITAIESDRYVQAYQAERKNDTRTEPGLMWSILYHFTDPGNQHMTTTHQGRRWALVIALLGVLLMSGVLVSSVTNLLDRRADAWANGECRYLPSLFGYKRKWRIEAANRLMHRFFFGRYAIIIGGHQSAIDICRLLQGGSKKGQKRVRTIFILTSEEVPALRNKLSSAHGVREEEIVLYHGSRTDEQSIKELHVEYAEEIYILGEGGDNPQHDVQNMACLQLVAEKLKFDPGNAKPIDEGKLDEQKEEERRQLYRQGVTRCYVQFEYQTAFAILQSSCTPGIVNNKIELMPYSFYENWAQKVLITDADPAIVSKNKQDRIDCYFATGENGQRRYVYAPIDGTGIRFDSRQRVHLVIVGMSKMGIALAIEAAHIAHYPNFVKDPTLRTRITFIDSNADEEMGFFMSRFKHLFSLARWRYAEAQAQNRGHYFKDEDKESKLFKDEESWNDPLQPGSASHNAEAYYADKEERPEASNFIDIEWEFIKGGVESPDVQRYLADAARDADEEHPKEELPLLTVAVCLPQEHEALASALYLPHQVYKNGLQVLVYQRHGSSVVDDMSGRDNFAFDKEKTDKLFEIMRYKKLHPFGMLNYGDMRRLNYQQTAHRGARIYDAIGEAAKEGVGARAQAMWEEAPIRWMTEFCDRADNDERALEWKAKTIWTKWSNIYNVNTLATKMRSMGTADEPAPFAAIAPYIKGAPYTLNIQCADGPVLLRRAMMQVPLQADEASLTEHERQLRMLRIMSQVEHNRWNIEKLLMGYRPITAAEFKEMFEHDGDGYKPRKAKLHKKYKDDVHRAHYCICSFDRLAQIDGGTTDYDVAFTLMLPYLYKVAKRNTAKQRKA